MTETQATTTEAAEEPLGPQDVHCRHCGWINSAEPGTDFQCLHCERWQNTLSCPTCHQPVHVDVLAAEQVPEPHAPVRRRAAKE